VSAQAKPISEVVKEFEQSLENLRPATRRIYVAGARTAIRCAHLELWQCPSTGELLASLGESPTEKKTRISPFLNFLGGGELEELVSDQDSAALQNSRWHRCGRRPIGGGVPVAGIWGCSPCCVLRTSRDCAETDTEDHR
jgi:hypothetical protein